MDGRSRIISVSNEVETSDGPGEGCKTKPENYGIGRDWTGRDCDGIVASTEEGGAEARKVTDMVERVKTTSVDKLFRALRLELFLTISYHSCKKLTSSSSTQKKNFYYYLVFSVYDEI